MTIPLERAPGRVEFFQVVRRLLRERADATGVGGAAYPADESIRFRSSTDFSFSAGDVSAVERGENGGPDCVEVGFMGVASPESFGSLPTPYTEEVNRQSARHNDALRDFLDLFNHRLVSLFYRAWERGRIDLLFERGGASPFESILRSAIGLEDPGLAERLPIDERALLSCAGLLAMRPAPASALESILASLFGLPVEVEQFVPAWFEIDADDRVHLGVHNTTLGSDLCLGEKACLLQPRFRVRMGPMDWERYEALLPGGQGFDAIVAVVRLAVGPEFDFDVRLRVSGAAIPAVRLRPAASASDDALRLGHTSWLVSDPAAGSEGQALFHCSSARSALPPAQGAQP